MNANVPPVVGIAARGGSGRRVDETHERLPRRAVLLRQTVVRIHDSPAEHVASRNALRPCSELLDALAQLRRGERRCLREQQRRDAGHVRRRCRRSVAEEMVRLSGGKIPTGSEHTAAAVVVEAEIAARRRDGDERSAIRVGREPAIHANRRHAHHSGNAAGYELISSPSLPADATISEPAAIAAFTAFRSVVLARRSAETHVDDLRAAWRLHQRARPRRSPEVPPRRERPARCRS